MTNKEIKICVIGLGYVGLPLCLALSRLFQVVGFDNSKTRIEELNDSYDKTNEVTKKELLESSIFFTSNDLHIKDSNIYIITVPTPIDDNNHPDVSHLKEASATVARNLDRGDIIVFESTVYPGATEEICVPILQELSGLEFNKTFFVGYSPERINPGDKVHTLSNIKKIVSASNDKTLKRLDDIYSSIITAGTYCAESIKIAEAAKVIENTQRDVNIALINEFAKIFNDLDIDTESVLNAAETKWNFINFRPGLVGGHCIGVDPYYLTYKAQEIGYEPEIILAGRNLNDGMSNYVSKRLLSKMNQIQIDPVRAKILILGYTFKENCNDTRNTKVQDLYVHVRSFCSDVEVYDPFIEELDNDSININFVQKPTTESKKYDAVILAVAHDEFKEMGPSIRSLLKDPGLIYDLKYLLPKDLVDLRL